MMPVGQIFTHRILRPWVSEGVRGTEIATYRCRVTRRNQWQIEFENLERLSVEDPLPGTDGALSPGGGMTVAWAKKLIERGLILLEEGL